MSERESLKIAVIGGDARQRMVARELRARGYDISEYALDGDMPSYDISEAVAGAGLAILPLPASRDGFRVNATADIPFEMLAGKLPRGCRVFAGRLQPALKSMLGERGFELFDFYADELFVKENTEISTDGTIHCLLEMLGGSLARQHILVCGYGRFGKCLGERLREKGAEVTVAARRDESLSLARANGFEAMKIDLARKFFFSVPSDCRAVLNTVPYHIFTEENIGTLGGKIYLELASAPFGGTAAMLEAVAEYKYLPAIPANFAPDRASKAMLGSLLRYIDKIRGDKDS